MGETAEQHRAGVWPAWGAAALAFGCALGATAFCRIMAGRGHGVFFGGIAVAATFTPFFTLIERHWRQRGLVALAAAAGIAAVWFSDSQRSIGFLAGAATLAAGWTLALCGVVATLRRLHLTDIAAAALTAGLALAWLTCPIWLSPHLAGRDVAMDRLARVHPLLALDGLLAPSDRPWSEHDLFYNHLGNLNQDVTYDPSAAPWQAAGLHSFLGAAGLAAAHIRRPRRTRNAVAAG